MLRINQLKLPVGHTYEELNTKVFKILRTKEIKELTIVRRSIDARKKPDLFFSYIIDVKVADEKSVLKKCDKKQVSLVPRESYEFPFKNVNCSKRPVIIGTGPAGLFCGYMLAQAGFKPILLERGKPVDERTKDVAAFWEGGKLNPSSNVQFGEGGAGTFSDGKLNTLVKDKYGRNKEVLSIFVKEGAKEEILYDQKPHIGTDVLSTVIKNMRERIISLGGEVRFSSCVTGFVIEKGLITGVVINQNEVLDTNHVVLAIGHSARDTFEELQRLGITMEAKPFAVGLRVEHPQKLINLSQYGVEEHEILGSAPYKLTFNSEKGRGVYSFCMCPGGYVVNASSETGRLAVNGMSYSDRNGENANSAIIVSVTPADFGDSDALAGIRFQQKLEEKAYALANGAVPVERYGDFKAAVCGSETSESESISGMELIPAIKGKWQFAKVHSLLPDELNQTFVEGMESFGKVIKGFNASEVLLEGIESRTSSPLRIFRDENLQSNIKGLYPCGEGAGYAGGITSAAMDGIKVAEELAKNLMNEENA